jgi:hypothetical protein
MSTALSPQAITNNNVTCPTFLRHCLHSPLEHLAVTDTAENSSSSKNSTICILTRICLVLYGCETWSLTLREEHRPRVFENSVLRRIFGPCGRAMAQAVSRRPSTAEARGSISGQSMWGWWWTKWHWDRLFSELSVFPCQFHSTGAPLIVRVGKKLVIFIIFITGVAQKALRLWCVRSICCGAPWLRKIKKPPDIHFVFKLITLRRYKAIEERYNVNRIQKQQKLHSLDFRPRKSKKLWTSVKKGA